MMSWNGKKFPVNGLCEGNHQWIIFTKGQFCEALMFPLMSACTNCWTNSCVAGELICLDVHLTSLLYSVNVNTTWNGYSTLAWGLLKMLTWTISHNMNICYKEDTYKCSLHLTTHFNWSQKSIQPCFTTGIPTKPLFPLFVAPWGAISESNPSITAASYDHQGNWETIQLNQSVFVPK